MVCFILFQFVPGGPVEEYIAQIQMAEGGMSATESMSEDEIDAIRANFGFDKPAWQRYLFWLGNLLTLDLGRSYSYNEPVLTVIVERFPISIFFGLTSFLLSYLICIPLGFYKAYKNGSPFDVSTSVLIFSGYVIPGYALGIILIIFFSGGGYFNWFPMTGIVSDYFEDLDFWNKVLDFAHHLVLPMICYMVGEFAVLTLLFKNSLLEEISKDYVRTSILKGTTTKMAIWRHAVRNALIPIITRVSEIFTIMFAGALLIEKIFDIDGMGLLSYNAIVSRDYNLVIGIIFLSSMMGLLGRLFSDILYVVVDPRISFK